MGRCSITSDLTVRQLGLISQEVETVLPALVATNKDEEHTKGINYIGLVPVTIKAMQEQQAQIEDRQKRIAELEKQKLQQQEQNRKLEERLAALEALLGKVSFHGVVEQE
jgi:TolA-binding protein